MSSPNRTPRRLTDLEARNIQTRATADYLTCLSPGIPCLPSCGEPLFLRESLSRITILGSRFMLRTLRYICIIVRDYGSKLSTGYATGAAPAEEFIGWNTVSQRLPHHLMMQHSCRGLQCPRSLGRGSEDPTRVARLGR